MDQLKEQLVKVKPYAFWIACGVILLGCLGTWYMSTGTLHQEKEDNVNKAKGAFVALKGIDGKSRTHPNKATADGMAALTRAYGEEIARGWALQYQRQEGVLVWPASFDEDFHNAVKPLKPIESIPIPTPIEKTINDSFRRRYRDFIEDELPKLATTIGGKWRASRDASGGAFERPPGVPTGPDGRPLVEADTSLVLWSPENQKEILLTHFGFTAVEDDPTTLQVLYAQEDLWVLQNLMNIVKKTNEGSEARHDAAVKQIEFIRIGKSALGYAGQVMPLGGPAASGAATGSEGMSGYPRSGPGGPTASPQPTANPAQPVAPVTQSTDPRMNNNFRPEDPANWRYVDQNNTPLAGVQLREALTAPTEQNALLTVAKRMPVRLRFEIDQRHLNKLLAEFGNASLPVEVRQIRINRDPAPIGSLEGFFTGGGTQGGGVREGGPYTFSSPVTPRGYEGGPGGIPGGGNLTKDATVDTNLIKLEVYGIVYLYNPVIRSVLGLEPAGSPTAMITPPAAGTGG